MDIASILFWAVVAGLLIFSTLVVMFSIRAPIFV